MSNKHHKHETPESPRQNGATSGGASSAAPVGEQAPAPVPPNELDALRAERDDLLGRLQRVSADFMNYQKRVQKEMAQSREFANDELLKATLAILDDMELAIAAARENHAPDDPLLAGVQLVHDKAMEIFGRFGLTVIPAEPGAHFDHAMHSAVLQQPSDQPAMTILQEARRGYQLRGRPIRPSSVVVSSGPAPAGDEQIDEEA